MLFSVEVPMARLQRRIVELLAADSDVAAFFGTGKVTAAGAQEYAFQIPSPSLLVLAIKGDPQDKPAGRCNLDALFSARAILPRPTPASSFVPTPAAPSVADPGSSITYRITECTARAESWASPPVKASGLTTLTLPAFSSGGRCFRIWRSEPERTACRWVGSAFAAGAWTDSADEEGGPELAPTFGLEWTLRGLVESALKNYSEDLDNLPEGTVFLARRLQVGKFVSGLLRTNQISHALELTYPAQYNPETQGLVTYT